MSRGMRSSFDQSEKNRLTFFNRLIVLFCLIVRQSRYCELYIEDELLKEVRRPQSLWFIFWIERGFGRHSVEFSV
jgi:hypothetical protein